MNPKIEKLKAEYAKNKDKITALKARNKEIARKVKEIQNTEIIGVFQELNMTPDEFAAFAAERKTAAVGRGGEDEED